MIIEQLLNGPHGIEHFKKMDFVCYTGGPLSQSAGDKLKGIVDLCQYYGSTETSNIQQLLPARENWAYMEWHPVCNIEMQPFNVEEATFEMVQFLDSSTRGHSLLNHNFPGLREWRTKDLTKRHPKNDKLWKFSGRVNDTVVLSDGHKFDPITAEAMIQDHPLVSGAVIIGQGRAQAALLLELKNHDNDSVSVIDLIMPIVEQANSRLPGQGRIFRSKILIASRDKPFHRTDKGTIIRKVTEKDFITEIERLYEEGDWTTKAQPPSWQIFEEEALRRLLQAIVLQCSPNIAISEQDDFFRRGLDSLKIVEMVRTIRASLRYRLQPAGISKLSSRMVYENSSIKKLASAISKLLNQDDSTDSERSTSQGNPDRVTAMGTMVANYTRGLDQLHNVLKQSTGRTTDIQISLTGSTGSLGSHLLRMFIEDSRIQKIWCLDRSEDAREKHHKDRNISETDDSRVVFTRMDFNEPHLGLSKATMSDLVANVDIIVHNAWKVDFNQALVSFEDHIRGTRSILDWAIQSPRKPRIIFISSMSSVANWPDVDGQALVPEAPSVDYSVASRMGYGESKLVAEAILSAASECTGIPVSILRVGQTAGSTVPTDTAWPAREWLPSLVKTSKTLGMIPDGLPEIDWIPIDALVKIIGEIIDADSDGRDARVYNLVNPKPVPWGSILSTIREYCGHDSRITPLAALLEELEKTDMDTLSQLELASKPALKVLPILRELVNYKTTRRYSTLQGIQASHSLRELQPVNQTWLQIWLEQWKCAGGEASIAAAHFV